MTLYTNDGKTVNYPIIERDLKIILLLERKRELTFRVELFKKCAEEIKGISKMTFIEKECAHFEFRKGFGLDESGNCTIESLRKGYKMCNERLEETESRIRSRIAELEKEQKWAMKRAGYTEEMIKRRLSYEY